MKNKTKVTSIRLPYTLYDEVLNLSKITDLSINNILCNATTNYLKQVKSLKKNSLFAYSIYSNYCIDFNLQNFETIKLEDFKNANKRRE